MDIQQINRTDIYRNVEFNAADGGVPENKISTMSKTEQNLAAGAERVAAKLQTLASRIQQRQDVLQKRAASSPTTAPTNSSNSKNTDSVDPALHAAAFAALEELSRSGPVKLESRLSEDYDPLQRHSLLREAINQSTGDSKEKLEGMLTRLHSKHGNEIEAGLKKVVSLEHSLAGMGSGATQKFSSFCGTKEGVKNQNPPSPLEMINYLKQSVGSKNVENGLATTPPNIANDLRMRNANATRGWWSLSVANSMAKARSTQAQAKKLRSKINEDTKINPRADDVDTTVALLEVSEKGGHPDQLAEKIVNPDDMKAEDKKSKVYRAIANTVRELPCTTEQANARMELIAGLDARTQGSDLQKSHSVNPRSSVSASALREKYLSTRPPAYSPTKESLPAYTPTMESLHA